MKMPRLFQISEAVFLFSCVYLWRQEYVGAETLRRDSETVASSSDRSNPNYFFYKQSEYPRDCQEALQDCPSLNSSGIYVIKPDGYPEPFDVYCDNDVSSSGWTVVQRRYDSHVEFDRQWEDFKAGFGFLSNAFWLGNEKLCYLTNQGVYELRVDLQLSDGSSFHVTYGGFLISDEWGQYRIMALGEYRFSGDGRVTPCPRNMVYGNCTCRGTCEEPGGSSGCPRDCELGMEGCSSPAGFLMNGDDYDAAEDCPCFWSDVNLVIPNGQSYVNDDCTERRSCTNNRLTQGEEYRCDDDARCALKNGVRQCYCDEGFRGDGQTCEPLYTDCYDAYNAGQRQDGVYLIKPTDWPGAAFNVSCVMSTNGGGWTVFQRRTGSDRQTDFHRNWTSYRDGFGSLSGDFWLGNEKIHYLTSQKSYKLRVDILDSSNSAIYNEWSSFSTGTEEDKYRLAISGYSGNTGTYFRHNNGKAFSTYDSDNDACERYHCAHKHRGGWWYSDNWCSYTRSVGHYCHDFPIGGGQSSLCTDTNLNGGYTGGGGESIFWYSSSFAKCHHNFAEMKIRPTN